MPPVRRPLEVALAQPLPVRRLHGLHPLREWLSAPARFLGQHLRQVGQLAGALHPGMRGEDLLDQGGAGARQAHDEDHLPSQLAGCAFGWRVERLVECRHAGGKRGAIPVSAASGQVVGLLDGPQRGCRMTMIVLRGGQREADRDQVVVAVAPVLQRRLHAGDVVLAELAAAQIGQTPPRHAGAGVLGQHAPILGRGLVSMALHAQDVGKQRARLHVARLQLHGALQCRGRLVVADRARQHHAQVVPGHAESWLQLAAAPQ